MKKKTYLTVAIITGVLVSGAACIKKVTPVTTTSNTSTTVVSNTTAVPSSSTTGDFSTSTNTASPQPIVTITAAGVDPNLIIIPVGTTVTFVNVDTIAHHVASDPHPDHTNLPGFENDAESESYSFTFTSLGRFGYHDHLDPENSALQGTIVVQ